MREARRSALDRMRRAGFEIGDRVSVVIDPRLPFMGYTFPEGDGFRIVASGMALESGLVGGLLIHEMSHIYRMQTNHPSHNGRIIDEVVKGLEKQALSDEYRQRIIHELVNHIQDLYADDIALRVFREGGFLPMEQLTGFLQDWVKDEPVASDDEGRDRWVNAAIVVNNARAIAQMARHGIEDMGGRAAATNERFLSRMSPLASSQFEYFRDLMVNLEEDITEREYRRLLTRYLKRFLQIAEGKDAPPEAPEERLSQAPDLDGVLEELDRSEARLTVRVESRRWGKPVTILQGLPKAGPALADLAHGLKERLATGGTTKDGLIVLQGDHRARIRAELVKMGFPNDHIQVH